MGSHPSNIGKSCCGPSSGHSNSPEVQGAALVSKTSSTVNLPSFQPPDKQEDFSGPRGSRKTKEEPSLGGSGLAHIWSTKLSRAGWTDKPIKLAEAALATSTRRVYDKALVKFESFSNSNGSQYPPVRTCDLAAYLCQLADNSDRPGPVVNTFLSALKQVFLASDLPDISETYEIKRLVTAITKSQTVKPMLRSSVLPVDRILATVKQWGSNDHMPLKFLRMKAIALLSLALMLRPSDVAPNATFFDKDSLVEKKMIFSEDMLEFHSDGVNVTLFGTKNDLTRKGFVVSLPCHSDTLVDPVATLKAYLLRTAHLKKNSAVFISLKAPYGPLSSSAIAKDLQECIDLSGLKGCGFSAKSFRPTGATVAIEKGEDPKMVQTIGRWKSTEVFYNHYVHCKTSDFTDNILS